MYGPHTLSAYLQEFSKLALALATVSGLLFYSHSHSPPYHPPPSTHSPYFSPPPPSTLTLLPITLPHLLTPPISLPLPHPHSLSSHSPTYSPCTLFTHPHPHSPLSPLLTSQGNKSEPGPYPPDYRSDQVSFHLPVVFDGVPSGDHFGSVHSDAKGPYSVVR